MNLLGLMISHLLERRLSNGSSRAHALALKGDVALEASGMQVTLRFGGDRIEVTREPALEPAACVSGTLPALLGAALGRHRVQNVLRGRLRATGNAKTLWHALCLLRA